jgi:Tol biopolymer transport system component
MRVLLAMTCMAATCLFAAPVTSAALTERVSVSSADEEALGDSGNQAGNWGEAIAISSDGLFVAFTSTASNLVGGDTNGTCDVFVRDRVLGMTERVSLSSSERQGNRSSCFGVAVSANGRLVAFASRASNLVRGDTNGAVDVFVRNRALGRTRRVSLRSDERQGNRSSLDPALSADGRFVVFTSSARLVRGDTTLEDVYIRDRALGRTRRVSVSSREVPGNDSSFDPAISAKGTIVAFASAARNLVRPDDNLDNPDIFIRILATGRTRRVSVDSDEHQLLGCSNGGSFSPALDEDGSRVVFTWIDGDCVRSHVMQRDRATGTTEQLDQGMGVSDPDRQSSASGISADGTVVAFSSTSTNLIPADTNGDPDADPFDPSGRDVFVVDVSTGAITRVSVSDGGAEADGLSFGGAISSEASFVAFVSGAPNLVASDTNGKTDVFVRGPL